MNSPTTIRRRYQGRRYGIIPAALVEDVRLGPVAFRIAAWLVTRPEGWEVRRWHLLQALGLGEQAWLSARKQLLGAGYLRVVEQRGSGGEFARPEYEFDEFAGCGEKGPDDGQTGETPVGRGAESIEDQSLGAPPEPGSTAPGLPGPGSTGRGSPGPGLYKRTNTSTTRTTTTARARERAGGGGGAKEKVLRAPTAAVAGEGAGAQKKSLGGLAMALAGHLPGLAGDELERIDGLAAGATPEQISFAVNSIRSAIESGRARDPVALAATLARRAASGALTAPAAAADAEKPTKTTKSAEISAVERARSIIAERIARGELVGFAISGPGIARTLMVEPDGGLVVETEDARRARLTDIQAAKVWCRVQSGELDCRPA